MNELSTQTRSALRLYGPEWGAAQMAAEHVQQALKALDAQNIGIARSELDAALAALPVHSTADYVWPLAEAIHG